MCENAIIYYVLEPHDADFLLFAMDAIRLLVVPGQYACPCILVRALACASLCEHVRACSCLCVHDQRTWVFHAFVFI